MNWFYYILIVLGYFLLQLLFKKTVPTETTNENKENQTFDDDETWEKIFDLKKDPILVESKNSSMINKFKKTQELSQKISSPPQPDIIVDFKEKNTSSKTDKIPQILKYIHFDSEELKKGIILKELLGKPKSYEYFKNYLKYFDVYRRN